MRKTLPLFLIAASAAWCQSPNPAGWGKIVWGMTVAEARAALGPAATTPTETPGPNLALIDRLMLAGIPIGNLTAEAAIQTAPGSDKVSAVTLSVGDLYDNPANRSAAFTTLQRLLTEKYGPPKVEPIHSAGRSGTIRNVLWTFPATSITLTWHESSGRYGIGYVRIRYEAVDHKASDVL
jgi:hypothetical protein